MLFFCKYFVISDSRMPDVRVIFPSSEVKFEASESKLKNSMFCFGWFLVIMASLKDEINIYTELKMSFPS